MSIETENIDVVILCGGQGRRLRSVTDSMPKAMAEINSHPFMDILIRYIASFGFKRFVLCTGYMGDIIEKYYRSRKSLLEIVSSLEKNPLGTGGAVKNAEHFIRGGLFMVVNGDSFCRVDLREFLRFHLNSNASASMVIKNADTEQVNDYGVISIGDSGRITAFDKKVRPGRDTFMNAGIYLFQRKILSQMPERQKFSLEKDFFPKIINTENVYGYKTQEYFIDIGTPETYIKAAKIFTEKMFGV